MHNFSEKIFRTAAFIGKFVPLIKSLSKYNAWSYPGIFYFYTMVKTIILFTVGFFLWEEHQRKRSQVSVFYVNNLWNNYNAVTVPPFGIFILKSEKGNCALLQHELIHWRQYQQEGLLPFIYNYYRENQMSGYENNKYEIEARIESGELPECIYNYSECVRCGNSITVYNPKFRT